MAQGKRAGIDTVRTGQNLKGAFDALGMSQKDVAGTFDISISTVSYWFSGKKLPSLSHMVRISALTGKTLDELVATEQVA